MPVVALQFFGQAFKANGEELFFTLGFPETACASMAIKGQYESDDRPVILTFPVLRPAVLGQSDPNFSAKQESLCIGAFGISSFNGVAWKDPMASIAFSASIEGGL